MNFYQKIARKINTIATLIIHSFIVIFFFLSSAIQADSQDVILSLPDNQILIHISATETQVVEQDLLEARLNFSAENKSPQDVQNKVNIAMKKALSNTKKFKQVKVSTGGYQVYEYTKPRTKEKLWKGQQSILLKSKNAAELLKLAGEIQAARFTMNGLNYVLSDEKQRATKDTLMEAALVQLQTRANRAAKALGKKTASIREVNVSSTNQNNFVRHNKMRSSRSMDFAEASSMAAPVAQGGESTINFTVSARVILKP